MEDKKMVRFTKRILDIMLFLGMIILAGVPVIIKYAGKYYSASIAEHYFEMVLVFMLAGVCGLLIVWQLRKMMKTVVEQDCFVAGNVKSLRIMGMSGFVITGLFIVKLFFLVTAATFIIIITFFIAGLFSNVLAYVFSEAIRYKEENDLTI